MAVDKDRQLALGVQDFTDHAAKRSNELFSLALISENILRNVEKAVVNELVKGMKSVWKPQVEAFRGGVFFKNHLLVTDIWTNNSRVKKKLLQEMECFC